MMTDPCHGCGVCCTDQRDPPYTVEELERLPKPLRTEVEGHIFGRTPISRSLGTRPVPCILFDMRSGRCREYEHRPQACRDFQVGGVECGKLRKQAGLVELIIGDM